MTPLLLPLAAVVAGMISFSSPCCLPLIPGYLSYVSALPVSELGRKEARAVTLRASLAFVAGFTVIFTALGIGAALLGASLLAKLPLVVRFAGVGIIVMGLAMLGLLRLPFLQREMRLDLARLPKGPRAAFPLGMAFAAGWAPCIGPVLATLLATAAASGTVVWGGTSSPCTPSASACPSWSWPSDSSGPEVHWPGCETTAGASNRRAGHCWSPSGCFVSGAWRTFFLPLQRYFARYGWPPV